MPHSIPKNGLQVRLYFLWTENQNNKVSNRVSLKQLGELRKTQFTLINSIDFVLLLNCLKLEEF